ncbi:CHAT domain-containing protein [Novosphingobium sp. Gsoil 351]|uniref:CHAT domain-containing protein n=1 Tax=Novosphingobium sp. Gsoil 351 TaxID=2675225 RepID=UPI0012B4D979|nr:CHAT domain-containing protein [Novosphingobium sp. Gsoil 351]QGN55778.1 CHAT domain-containing protein [Novosphingobium sp. Gsoil 351]
MCAAEAAPSAPSDEAAFKAQIKLLEEQVRAVPASDRASAQAILRQIATLKRDRFGATSKDYFYALSNLAIEAEEAKNYEASIQARREMLAVCEARAAAVADPRKPARLGEDSPYECMLYAAYNLASDFEEAGHPDQALAVLKPLATDAANDRSALFAERYGPDTFPYGAVRYLNKPLNRLQGLYARLALAHGDDSASALSAAHQAMLSARLYRQHLGSSRTEEWQLGSSEHILLSDNDAGEDRFGDFARLYADAAWTAGKRDAETSADVFLTLQDVTLDRTTRALGRAAAERAAAKHGASALFQQRAALSQQSEALLKTLAANSGNMTQPEKDATYTRIQQIDASRDAVDAKLGAAAPEFFALVRPRPLAPLEAKALFRPGDAGLLVMPTIFGTHVFLVDHQGVTWRRSDLGADALNKHVRRLLWDAGADVDATAAEELRWQSEGTGQFPFDRTTAHLLYRELVEPFATQLKNTKFLYIVASGSLSSLPFSLLVADTPSGADGDPAVLRATPWLGDRLTLLQLPSLQTLQLLRAEPGGAEAADRLVGFGDPVLDGEALDRGASPKVRRTRSGGGLASAGFNSFAGDQPLADPATLRTLARLPGTARELTALKAAFGPELSRIMLAETARETAFKSADLTRLSVLALSTHGLLTGEAGAAEPGLVLTPPATATVKDDGYLAASEIAGLDIDAQWVILSACNTAGGDGSEGATGLSGLVRAFFFAGARSVLASHWPVKDAVAEKMIPLILTLQRAHPEWTRAEALQAAEKAIRDDAAGDADFATWAHPSAWAPFAFIGDSGR